jgi:D-alanine transaminase
MPRLAYVNGRFVRHEAAAVHIEDRGYQFADGVYEVIPIVRKALLDEAGHLDRLERSLRELRICSPKKRRTLQLLCRELIRRNGVTDGYLYLQITRGVAPREHAFPKAGTQPSLVITTRHLAELPQETLDRGVKVITVPDIRWKRRDIKSVSLLPNVLAKQEAVENGAYEAWQVDDHGRVTEGSSTNAWIVTKDGVLVTRPAGPEILNGVTRQGLMRLAGQAGYPLEERSFTVAEAKAASEAFLTASSLHVLPVTRIDDSLIGGGRPGPLARRLRDGYIALVLAEAEGAS